MNQELNLPIENLNKYLELLKLKKELLERNPKLVEVQERIDKTLDEVGSNPIERCQVMQQIMIQSAYQLGQVMKETIDYINEVDLPETMNTLVRELKR